MLCFPETSGLICISQPPHPTSEVINDQRLPIAHLFNTSMQESYVAIKNIVQQQVKYSLPGVPGPSKRHFKLHYKGFRKLDIKTWFLSPLTNTDGTTDVAIDLATQNSPQYPLQASNHK